MGKNNRERRAAKVKKRRQQQAHNRRSPSGTDRSTAATWGPHGPGCTCDPAGALFDGHAPPTGPSNEPPTDSANEALPTDAEIENMLDSAAFAGRRDVTYAAHLVSGIVDGESQTLTSRVDRVASVWVNVAVRRAWESGWQPRDVVECIRRSLKEAGERFVTDAIASEMKRYAPATIDDRWAGQLEELGAEAWWSRDQNLISAWSARRGDRLDVLHLAVRVVGELKLLPRMERALPLPGEAKSRGAGRRRGDVDEKILARIRALLAKAESTDFPEEAEALSGKAQQLMTKFSLDRALVYAAGDTEDDVVTARRVWLDKPYVSAKSMLVSAAARANRCRTVFSKEMGMVSVIGDETDLRLVEVLATSLLVQANRAMLTTGSRRGAWGQNETRSYRQSFLVSYGSRIGERLNEAASAGRAEVADEASLLPVLAAKDAQVDAAFAKLFPHTRPMKVSVSNSAGWRDGRVAADLANLDVHRSVGQVP